MAVSRLPFAVDALVAELRAAGGRDGMSVSITLDRDTFDRALRTISDHAGVQKMGMDAARERVAIFHYNGVAFRKWT